MQKNEDPNQNKNEPNDRAPSKLPQVEAEEDKPETSRKSRRPKYYLHPTVLEKCMLVIQVVGVAAVVVYAYYAREQAYHAATQARVAAETQEATTRAWVSALPIRWRADKFPDMPAHMILEIRNSGHAPAKGSIRDKHVFALAAADHVPKWDNPPLSAPLDFFVVPGHPTEIRYDLIFPGAPQSDQQRAILNEMWNDVVHGNRRLWLLMDIVYKDDLFPKPRHFRGGYVLGIDIDGEYHWDSGPNEFFLAD